MHKRIAVISAALAASVVMTGCGSGNTPVKPKTHKTSVSGTVTEREIESSGYELDIVDATGKEHEIKVTYSVYKRCVLYSHYPSCNTKSAKPKLNNSGKVNKLPKQKAPKKEKKVSSGKGSGKTAKKGKK